MASLGLFGSRANGVEIAHVMAIIKAEGVDSQRVIFLAYR